MHRRHSELAEHGPVIRLADADARAVYRLAKKCASCTRCGLDEDAFAQIECLDVNDAPPNARLWLTARVDGDELLLVFGQSEVFRLSTSLFLDNWQDMFCPSRDDVVILPVAGNWALFYSHEDEFEFEGGGAAEPNAAADRGNRYCIARAWRHCGCRGC
jgi:hypothetical protein